MSDQPVLLCHDCDLLVENIAAVEGQRILCPRCGATLYEGGSDTSDSVLALSITGLLLYIPANTLPVMTLGLIGQSSSNTVVGGILTLIDQGYWWMAILVLLASVVVPLIELVILLILALAIRLGRWRDLGIVLLKWQGSLTDWGMLEVYMLGILVAFIKMKDIGNLTSGLGLFCFVGLLLATLAANQRFDRHRFWCAVDAIGQHRQHKRKQCKE